MPNARRRSAAAAAAAAARRRRPKELREIGRTPRTPLSQSSSSSYGGHRHSVSVVRWCVREGFERTQPVPRVLPKWLKSSFFCAGSGVLCLRPHRYTHRLTNWRCSSRVVQFALAAVDPDHRSSPSGEGSEGSFLVGTNTINPFHIRSMFFRMPPPFPLPPHAPGRYPVDTGLFVSGGMDGVVKLWDTNALGVVLEFDFKDKVRSVWKERFMPNPGFCTPR